MKELGYTTPKILLASRSPRRHDLLAQLGVEFTIVTADIDESVHPNEHFDDYVRRVAQDKARAALQRHPDQIILAADTIVVLGEEILLKPRDRDDHFAMLSKLSGKSHRVLTAVALAKEGDITMRVSDTQVSFRELNANEIRAYWETGEPQDKSGGYASQGMASIFIEHLQGSWSGVVGLPLFETFELLQCLSFKKA